MIASHFKTIHADADRWRPSSLSVAVDAGAHQAPDEIGRQQQMINPQVFSASSHGRRNVWLRQHGLGLCSYRNTSDNILGEGHRGKAVQ